MAPIVSTAPIGFALIITTIPAFGYLIDASSIYSASAVAASIILRRIAGALIPMAGPALYAKLGVGWGNSIMGFISLLFVLLLITLNEIWRTSSEALELRGQIEYRLTDRCNPSGLVRVVELISSNSIA